MQSLNRSEPIAATTEKKSSADAADSKTRKISTEREELLKNKNMLKKDWSQNNTTRKTSEERIKEHYLRNV